MQILSKIYGKVVKIRNYRYDSGKEPVYKCPKPVISIGNLCAGGSGKTPFTLMLAERLIKKGYKPGIISRGWGRKSKDCVVVSDGKSVLCKQESAGDEMFMLAQKLKIPIVVHNKKEKAAEIISDRFSINCVLVDDGFQRRSLFRDLDIVIIDRATLERPVLLPSGRLREPLTSLKRADIIAFADDVKYNEIKEFADKNACIIRIRTFQDLPYSLFNKDLIHNIDETAIAAVTAIAKPERYIRMLEKSNIKVEKRFIFRDHYPFSYRAVNRILRQLTVLGIKLIAVTEKDAVKLSKYEDLFLNYKINCAVFPIHTEIIENEAQFFSNIEAAMK